MYKNVKNLNLRVDPARQQVRMSVPRRVPDEAVFDFIEKKMDWIRKHLKRRVKRRQETAPEFRSGEEHGLWGQTYSLQVMEANSPYKVEHDESGILHMRVRPGTDRAKRASLLKEYRRKEMKATLPGMIRKWEPRMGVSVEEFGVKQMKTRWGTCNIRDRRIWLNLELAKMRPELLEYVVVHEMVHLLERLHNKRFYAYMSQFLPHWKSLKEELNGRSSISDC